MNRVPVVPKGNMAPAAAVPTIVAVRTSLELLALLMGAGPLMPKPPQPPPIPPFWAAVAAAAACWARFAAMGSAERASGAGDEALVETAALVGDWYNVLFATWVRAISTST